MNNVRELPTFARSTIIGLGRFHFCVRDGNRWSTSSITPLHYSRLFFLRILIVSRRKGNKIKVWFISTAWLKALLLLHLQPINPVVYGKSKSSDLGVGFVLICFQRLSLPDLATQQCSWQNSWQTRGQFTKVLSYYQQIPSKLNAHGR